MLTQWRKFRHAQLGDVEIGGPDPRVGLWNPPYEKIDEVCRGQSAAFMRVAALAPSIIVADSHLTPAGGDLVRLDLRVENQGYLATYGPSSAKKLDWNEPLVAEITTSGCSLANPREARQEVGHLDGWGRGKYDGTGALYHMRSRGNTGAKTLSWTLRGKGLATVRIGSCRTGWITKRVEVG